jgi:hypothetical protein
MSSRKFFAFLLPLLLISSIFPSARADDYIVNNLESCTNAIRVNCIVSVIATFPSGKTVAAIPTGKHADGKCAGINGLSHTCSFNEWEVQGLMNEDGSNLIQTTGWIQPPSQATNPQLPPGGLLFFVAASGWRDQKKINSPKCSDSRYNCNWSYDLQPEVSWSVTVRENTMVPAYTTGTLNDGRVNTSLSDGTWTVTYVGVPGMTAGILASPIAGDEIVPDRPDWPQQLWSIRTIDAAESNGLGVHGVDCHGANPSLMTDALWVGLPSFDQSTKEVSLDVNNPHFDVNGDVAKGHFQAYFPKEFTECYWGMSPKSAAGQAQISITENNGASEVAILATKADENGLTVSASGFHYSAPKISIKLPSDPVIAPLPISSPPKVVVKKTLTCVKKSMKKIVVGISPKCPTGFKVK